jgi:hypothetical protein
MRVSLELGYRHSNELLLGVSKKTDKLIKLKKKKQNNWKNQTEKKNRVNRLKNHKNILVQFGFGFQNLKLIEPNQTEPVQPGQHLKKKQV